jgi:nucleoid-associated protein YgaU
MRKDVKLAFVVGGILISVLVVYVLVVPSGQKRSDRQAVTLDEARGDAISPAAVPGDKAALSASEKAADAKTNDVKPTDAKTTDARPADQTAEKPADDKASAAPTTKPTDPFASASDKDNSELWMAALNRGTVPMMTTSAPPAPTPTLPTVAGATPKASKLSKKSAAEPASFSKTASPLALETPSTRPSAPEAAPTGDARTHVVKEGETFSKISEAVYGSPNYWPYIVRANPGIVANKIRAGMTINIPPVSEVKGAASSDSASAASDSSGPKPDITSPKLDAQTQYEVQPGDSLQKIAIKLYGNSAKWQAIYDTNKEAIGPDPAKVKAKSVLKLPEPPTVKS